MKARATTREQAQVISDQTKRSPPHHPVDSHPAPPTARTETAQAEAPHWNASYGNALVMRG
jgi:hypothetical protein